MQKKFNGQHISFQVLTDLIWDWIETLGNLPLHRVEFSWMRRSRNLCYLCPSQVAEVSGLVFSISMHVNSSVAYTFRTHTFFERVKRQVFLNKKNKLNLNDFSHSSFCHSNHSLSSVIANP